VEILGGMMKINNHDSALKKENCISDDGEPPIELGKAEIDEIQEVMADEVNVINVVINGKQQKASVFYGDYELMRVKPKLIDRILMAIGLRKKSSLFTGSVPVEIKNYKPLLKSAYIEPIETNEENLIVDKRGKTL
jgi:hypothetical protein